MDSVIYGWLLRRPEWRKFREDVLEQRGCQCEREGCLETENLEIHHTVYYKGRFPWNYSIDDMRVYCHTHHMETHRLLDIIGSGPEKKESREKLNPDELCPHCLGYGYLSENQDLVGGKCLKCFGLTRVLPERVPLDICVLAAKEFWEDWKEKRPDSDRFQSLWNVFDWIGKLQGYTDEDLKPFSTLEDLKDS